jgi:NAD(P)-dependent dehydrogenase (short-subunit alcohol dehydrogenase family)
MIRVYYIDSAATIQRWVTAMTDGVSRRGFLRSGISVATVAPGVVLTWDFFRSPDCAAWMVDQIFENYQLQDAARKTVETFVARIQDDRYLQTESAQFIKALWSQGNPSEDDLARYLVQEFAVSTNILEYHDGSATELIWTGYPTLDEHPAVTDVDSFIG